MSSNPLSYDGLKYVLQYMEVNKRVLLSNKCPTIRIVEKIVPLKIDYLKFLPGQIKLNRTTYRIGIYQHYPTGQAPPAIEKNNEKGGVQHDVDRFGIKIRNTESVVMPGDIKLAEEWISNFNITDDDVVLAYQMNIPSVERELQERPSSRAEEMLESSRASLVAFQHRLHAVDPPYEQLIQVTVDSQDDESRYIERYRHNKWLRDAMKQLATFIFGKRPTPILVNHLFVDSNILRLPIGVQLQISELSFMRSVKTGLEALKTIINEASFPLRHFKCGRLTLADLTLPTVREAIMLTIVSTHELASARNLLMNTTNQRVVLSSLFSFVSTEDVLILSENWVQVGRPIGTHFSFVFPRKDQLMDRVGEIQRRYHRFVHGKITIIPMTEARQLKVYHDTNMRSGSKTWNMHMIVEAMKQN